MVAVIMVLFVGVGALLCTFIENLINENEQLKEENEQLRKVKRI